MSWRADYDKMGLPRAVYTASRDGILKHLKELLVHRDQSFRAHLVDMKTHNATPLVMACRNGHLDVAEYLIDVCGADIEQPGSVVFDGETIEGAPPLWCAAAAGHYALVRLLVRNGALINSTTKTHSTPLRAACFDGHFDIVKFLVNNGADIELANRHGHTCLMIACYRGHVHVAKYLLALKADTNRKSIKGNTALHDCAESGSLEILKALVEHGARMDFDTFKMTPLLAAAVTGHTHIVEHLIGLPNFVSRKDRIDALELLGATYVDKKRDMLGALEFWKRAMDERYRGDGPVIPKPPPPPGVAAYDYAREIRDAEALDDLLADPDEMRMQALVIRERILGPAHPDTSYYIRYRGAIYADTGKFSRCIELWNYALDMQQSMLEPLNAMTQSSFFGFTELFSFMVDEEGTQTGRSRRIPPADQEELMRVFKKAVLEVYFGKQLPIESIPEDTYLDRILVITLHLACLLTRRMPEPDTPEYVKLHQAMYELVQLDARNSERRDVLHMAQTVDAVLATKFPACKFPSLNLTTVLLRAGADPMSVDEDGNTALHLAATSHPARTDIAIALLKSGAHLDAVNSYNQTYESILRKKDIFDSINPLKYTTLACLAARVVARTHKFEAVPEHLKGFVLLHDSSWMWE